MRTAYEELQISFRKREDLEYSTRTRMEAEISELQENNRNLQGENVLSLETLICFRTIFHDRKFKVEKLIFVRYLYPFQKLNKLLCTKSCHRAVITACGRINKDILEARTK